MFNYNRTHDKDSFKAIGEWNRICQWSDGEIRTRKRKIVKLIVKQGGLSSKCRWLVWKRISKFDDIKSEISYSTYLTVQTCSAMDATAIALDVPRTFPHLPMYRTDCMKSKLNNVLCAIAGFDSHVGFCQGMSFVAGALLSVLSEEDTFYLMATIWRKYDLHRLYCPGVRKLKEVLFVTEQLFVRKMPVLSRHMDTIGLHLQLFVVKWAMTIFSVDFELEFVRKIWDLFLLNGWVVVYQVTLAILKHEGPRLLKTRSLETSMQVVLDITKRTSSDLYQNRILKTSCKMVKESEMNKLVALYHSSVLISEPVAGKN